MAMPPLDERSLKELLDAKEHIENLMGYATEERRKNGGPGWDAVWAMLERDYAEVLEAISLKQS